MLHHTAFTRSKTKLGLSGGESGSWIFSGSSGTSGRFSGSRGAEQTLSLSVWAAGLAQLSGVRRLDGDACAEGLASKAFGASLNKNNSVFFSTGDPDPDDFWPPGSGSTSQMYGSGSGSFPFLIKVLSGLKKCLQNKI